MAYDLQSLGKEVDSLKQENKKLEQQLAIANGNSSTSSKDLALLTNQVSQMGSGLDGRIRQTVFKLAWGLLGAISIFCGILGFGIWTFLKDKVDDYARETLPGQIQTLAKQVAEDSAEKIATQVAEEKAKELVDIQVIENYKQRAIILLSDIGIISQDIKNDSQKMKGIEAEARRSLENIQSSSQLDALKKALIESLKQDANFLESVRGRQGPKGEMGLMKDTNGSYIELTNKSGGKVAFLGADAEGNGKLCVYDTDGNVSTQITKSWTGDYPKKEDRLC